MKIRIIQNPDREHSEKIRKQIEANGGYCPCSLVKNNDTRCLCKDFLEKAKRGELGACHCGLYIAVEDNYK